MTTLAADTNRVFELGDINELPMVASDIIYAGAAVGDNASGYARPLVAGDKFKGFADKKADNATGAAGDVRVRVKAKGRIQLSISGLVVGDLGKRVYASDDNVFTLTATGNSEVGFIYRFVSSGVGITEFDTITA